MATVLVVLPLFDTAPVQPITPYYCQFETPGDLKYGPNPQTAKCNALFLCLCAMQVLEMIVRRKMKDSTRPSDTARLIAWLSDIRLKYNSTMERLGIKDQDQEQGSLRMIASSTRKKASKEVDRMEGQPSSKSIITLRFLGGPDSVERRQQYDQMEAQHESRKKRFISLNNIPSPKGIQPFTDEYVTWFMKGVAGASIFKSANAMSNNPIMSSLNEDQKHEYLRLCIYAPFNPKTNKVIHTLHI
ncbi:hypothetical protein O0I10_003262 [Lichtheimia ornata]|uniref:Uncharacterized protein n=1 Tax=Lichtheimia ornata TaxID=688661 RepID=A0AAD7Y056_9FUNG|nr:uncharacterized protein O0I10_003262 [Lichtheimia ornata]KAJ8661040.1 hypothetical protein O0I10_003262 [Lichtheimia ornata]